MLALRLDLSSGIARCAHRNWPVRSTASVRSQSASATSSHAAVGPAMPALLTSVSRPPSAEVAAANSRSTAAGSATSHSIWPRAGSLAATAASAFAVDVADEDARAFANERARRREADAGRPRRHEHAQSFYLEVHRTGVGQKCCERLIGSATGRRPSEVRRAATSLRVVSCRQARVPHRPCPAPHRAATGIR